MATTWSEENIGSSSFTKENLGASTWTEENATVERWIPEGPEIYLATEGERALIMSEGELEFLMYSRLGSWIEDVLNSASWTKLNVE